MSMWDAAIDCAALYGGASRETLLHAAIISSDMPRWLDRYGKLCLSRTKRQHHRTTETPIARAVPMIDLQMDSSGMNSHPGSVCFTCIGPRDERGPACQRTHGIIKPRAGAFARAFAIS